MLFHLKKNRNICMLLFFKYHKTAFKILFLVSLRMNSFTKIESSNSLTLQILMLIALKNDNIYFSICNLELVSSLMLEYDKTASKLCSFCA